MAKKKQRKSRTLKTKRPSRVSSVTTESVVANASLQIEEHPYVRKELARIAIVTATLLALQIAMWVVLRMSGIDEAVYGWIQI